MEFLATVRDGSAHDFALGYWALHVIGAEVDSNKMTPLYQRLWSAEAPDFTSDNDEILRAIDAVMAHVGRRGLWVMDRGGDRINLFGPMLDRGARFLFRLVGNRNLIYNGKTLLAQEVAKGCRCKHAKTVTRIVDGKEKTYTLSVLSARWAHRFGICGRLSWLCVQCRICRPRFPLAWPLSSTSSARCALPLRVQPFRSIGARARFEARIVTGPRSTLPMVSPRWIGTTAHRPSG